MEFRWDGVSPNGSNVAHAKAVCHTVRLSIIDMLDEGQRLTVTEIYTRLNADQSSVSHHASILRDKGILAAERQGKFIFYFLKNKSYLSLIDCLNDIQQKQLLTSFELGLGCFTVKSKKLTVGFLLRQSNLVWRFSVTLNCVSRHHPSKSDFESCHLPVVDLAQVRSNCYILRYSN